MAPGSRRNNRVALAPVHALWPKAHSRRPLRLLRQRNGAISRRARERRRGLRTLRCSEPLEVDAAGAARGLGEKGRDGETLVLQAFGGAACGSGIRKGPRDAGVEGDRAQGPRWSKGVEKGRRSPQAARPRRGKEGRSSLEDPGIGAKGLREVPGGGGSP